MMVSLEILFFKRVNTEFAKNYELNALIKCIKNTYLRQIKDSRMQFELDNLLFLNVDHHAP